MRKHWLTAIELLLLHMSVGLPAPTAHQYSRGVDWLSRYGYLPRPDPHAGKLQTHEGIQRALREMQRFAGLKETGRLDNATLALMSTPRCSLPDIVGTADLLRKKRKRRYALSGLQWDKTDITWSLHSYPSSFVSASSRPELVELIMLYALKVWSDVTPLRFQRLSTSLGKKGEEGDIRVSFIKSFHDDGYPFDGKGGTLAHAFFPGKSEVAGDTHFDDDEVWSYEDDRDSTDLFPVAVHEFGHALGLSHSSSDSSIMRPYYQGSVGSIHSYILPTDDRLGIQMLYGSRKKPNSAHPDSRASTSPPYMPSPPPPRPTRQSDRSLPNRCEGGYDAVANIRGEVFFFKGPYFWRIHRSGSLVSLSPALIRNFWTGLPLQLDRVDAVYERRSSSHIIFFIGEQYWVFKDTTALPGYPRPLSEWGVKTAEGEQPTRIGAAFVWAHNGKTYLFSGGRFWRFDEGGKGTGMKPEKGYPKNASLWSGVPSDPDDIISWGNGDAYFFKNNAYWVLERGGLDQENVNPKSIALDWMRCTPPSISTHSPAKSAPGCCECSCKSHAMNTQVFHWPAVMWLFVVQSCF